MEKKKRVWDEFLNDVDRKVIEKLGYGKIRGIGKRPCLMIIDAQYNYVGSDKPILEQLDEWPTGVGERAWVALRKCKKLLQLIREKHIPVIYTRQVQTKYTVKFDLFSARTGRETEKYVLGHKGVEIVEELKPKDGDIVIDKNYASAFYGTPLISILVSLGVDSIIIVGGTTSGCVRATAIDAAMRGFKVVVIEDCVFDRFEFSHKASLFDLWAKYADVISLEEVLEMLKNLTST